MNEIINLNDYRKESAITPSALEQSIHNHPAGGALRRQRQLEEDTRVLRERLSSEEFGDVMHDMASRALRSVNISTEK